VALHATNEVIHLEAVSLLKVRKSVAAKEFAMWDQQDVSSMRIVVVDEVVFEGFRSVDIRGNENWFRRDSIVDWIVRF